MAFLLWEAWLCAKKRSVIRIFSPKEEKSISLVEIVYHNHKQQLNSKI